MDSQNKGKVSIYRNTLQGVCHIMVVMLVLLSLSGCSRRYSDLPAYWPIPFREYDNSSVGRFKTSYLAKQIDEYYRGTSPGPIGVTTLVNLDDLYTTSTFGRVYAEQLMGELTMLGYDVVELRQSDALRFLRDGGEFALSREPHAVRRTQELGGIVVGTYVASPDRVYVNARLVDPASAVVLSAGSVEMGKTRELAKLLRTGGTPGTMERIPVKHLAYGSIPLTSLTGNGKLYDLEESPGGKYGVQPKLADSLKK